ncbi:hypothetical protein Syun_025108 [Stephania yunnanensis]|uniref:FAD-binding PCMH-type domain-containing protein n=1 Tax=Stephania yunnanensis TaxID=152371 RepID=A0AAP0EY51_9MAGN
MGTFEGEGGRKQDKGCRGWSGTRRGRTWEVGDEMGEVAAELGERMRWRHNNAWVQAGATLGELYYSIAEKSHVHGFPSGQGRTIGVGGHFSVAGFGPMLRKYGTAADQIIDARLVNANGEVLNREAMGEDLFWAIRRGGASSFGVVLAWKINLVAVPPIVTVASLDKAYEQGATELVHKWQTVASRQVPRELYIELIVGVSNNTNRLAGRRAIELKFKVMFLGPSKKLMQ